jgi:hypothetical protein
MRLSKSLLLLPVCALLTACGSDPVAPPVSKGRQLSDLQDAYQDRAITDDEYEDEKEKILEQ